MYVEAMGRGMHRAFSIHLVLLRLRQHGTIWKDDNGTWQPDPPLLRIEPDIAFLACSKTST
jgi:hypothetical protein